MIKIENTEVLGWEHAIRGMRNPMNSWGKSDSQVNDCGSNCAVWEKCGTGFKCPIEQSEERYWFFCLGKNDLDLMTRLRNAGTDHRKFMRMITVYVDITAPLYWWKEFDTYKVGTVANSCSTMHKIHAKEFRADDFSYDRLDDGFLVWTDSDMGMYSALDVLGVVVEALNNCREAYLKTKNKKYWYSMIQLLPSSYNQLRTVTLNYEVLANMYAARKGHKLDEWHDLCHWIEELPYSQLITGD